MPHERHTYAKSYDIEKATMCAYSHSYSALPHWICILRCCAKCPSINFSDLETDDKHPNPPPSIHFHIYHMIARCTTYGRLPLNDKKFCCNCQQDIDSGQSIYIYTIENSQWRWRNPFPIFVQFFIFQQSRSWSFSFQAY